MDWEYFEISPRMRMIVEHNEQGNTELIIAVSALFLAAKYSSFTIQLF